MRKLGEITDFTVVSFNSAAICGGVFNLRAGKWQLSRTAVKKLAGAKDESALWRELWRELHGGKDLFVMTGAIPDGVFFTFDTVPLPPREQREALMMELPRQLLTPQNDPVLQFMPAASAGSDELESLNVYTVERKSLEAALSPLRRGRLRADELVHPLLMVKPGDPAVFLPGIDPGFCFKDRRFHRTGNDDGERLEAEKAWRKLMEKHFVLNLPDAQFTELFPVLLVARAVASGDFRDHRKELQFLPREVHPVRFRSQLRLTALLVALLLAVLLWRFGGERWKDFREYRAIIAETNRLKAETARMQKTVSTSTREQKEMLKVLNAETGSRRALSDLAEISELLPQSMMVSNFRWGENEIALSLQSENENINLPDVFAPRWKVADIQHLNRRQSAATVINVKLVPANRKADRKDKKRQKRRK